MTEYPLVAQLSNTTVWIRQKKKRSIPPGVKFICESACSHCFDFMCRRGVATGQEKHEEKGDLLGSEDIRHSRTTSRHFLYGLNGPVRLGLL